MDWHFGRPDSRRCFACGRMLQAAKDAKPRRKSVLEHALANDGDAFENHPLGPVPE